MKQQKTLADLVTSKSIFIDGKKVGGVLELKRFHTWIARVVAR